MSEHISDSERIKPFFEKIKTKLTKVNQLFSIKMLRETGSSGGHSKKYVTLLVVVGGGLQNSVTKYNKGEGGGQPKCQVTFLTV